MSIRARRLDKGWSQEELARHSGLSTRTIQRIESGQNAGLESLKCLAAVFDTSVSTLMEEFAMKNETNNTDTGTPLIHKIERDSIEFAQSILHGPQKSQREPLSKIEREAIDFAKQLLGRFSS